MGMTDEIEEQAVELLASPDDTYEVAVRIAGTAANYCPGGWNFDKVVGTELARTAASVRDMFGTWAQRIHTHGHLNGSSKAEALDAHQNIERAVNDWLGSGQLDPAAFVARWLAVVGPVDVAWLEDGRDPVVGA